MNTIDRDYFASLPDKEMECKPIVMTDFPFMRVLLEQQSKPHATVVVEPYDPPSEEHTESIPAAFSGAMTKVIALMILGLCVVSFGVLMVVFGGGK